MNKQDAIEKYGPDVVELLRCGNCKDLTEHAMCDEPVACWRYDRFVSVCTPACEEWESIK
jgi:hypothetical protein